MVLGESAKLAMTRAISTDSYLVLLAANFS
jgi:hypothetical protein